MLKPHLEILDKERLEVFYKLPQVTDEATLTGGTALALQIGHRRSEDFDLTFRKTIKPEFLRIIINTFSDYKIRPLVDSPNELTVILGKYIKLTYFHFPFPNLHPNAQIGSLKLDSLYDIASNKAHTIGRRGEWKDYVDIYFLLSKENLDIQKIINETEK